MANILITCKPALTNKLLCLGDKTAIFRETEGFIGAIQNQVVSRRSYLKYIVRVPSVITQNA